MGSVFKKSVTRPLPGLGLTNYAVGEISGIDAATILRLMSGEPTLTIRTAEKEREALDMVFVPRPGRTLPLDIVRDRGERN